jgi:hypothetical protein
VTLEELKTRLADLMTLRDTDPTRAKAEADALWRQFVGEHLADAPKREAH